MQKIALNLFKANKYLTPTASKTRDSLIGQTPMLPDPTENEQNPSNDDWQDMPPTSTVSDMPDPLLEQPDSDQNSQTVPLPVPQNRETPDDLSNEPLYVELQDVNGNPAAVPNPALQKNTRSGEVY